MAASASPLECECGAQRGASVSQLGFSGESGSILSQHVIYQVIYQDYQVIYQVMQNLQTYNIRTPIVGIRTAGHLQQSHFGLSQREPVATCGDRFERTGALLCQSQKPVQMTKPWATVTVFVDS